MLARTGTVLISSPTMDSAPGHLGLTDPGPRGAEGDVVPTGQRREQQRPGPLQHGADGGAVRRAPPHRGPGWSARRPRRNESPAAPATIRSFGPTRVGVSKSTNVSRQAARAASESRSASHVDEAAVGDCRGQSLPGVGGEDLPHQDRQRPAVHQDVMEGQQQPVPLRCDADQRHPEPRGAGQVADRVAVRITELTDQFIGIPNHFR